MSFGELLLQGKTTNAILFCGSGFSADCLNTELEKVGTAAPLLGILNSKLGDPPFTELSLAADEFIAIHGEYILFKLLSEQYQIREIPDSILEILAFNWSKIYTTNYDDVIEKSLERLGKSYSSFNNSNSPSDIVQTGTPVIHLHGGLRHWGDLQGFSNSCVLSAESYLRHAFSSKWNKHLELDYNKSTIFVFIGFSASDLYLNQIFHNAAEGANRTFFINSNGSTENREQLVRQRRFGTSLAIGREGLVAELRKTVGKESKQLVLKNFQKFDSDVSSESVPSNASIRELFMFGKHNQKCLKWDVERNTSDFRVERPVTSQIIEHSKIAGSITFLVGDACSGKSITIQEVMTRASTERDVYQLSLAYDSIVDEAKQILQKVERALLIVEAPFSMREETLAELIAVVASSKGSAVFSSRGIVFDFSRDLHRLLSAQKNYKIFELGKLSEAEIDSLIVLAERIAGWRDFEGTSHSQRKRFIEKTCNAQIPDFLLQLLGSPNIRSILRTEYKTTIAKYPELSKILMAALYFKHIDVSLNSSVFSSLLGEDAATIIGKCPSEFASMKRGTIETIPTFGAQIILKEIVPDDEIISLIIDLVKDLLDFGRLEGSYFQTFRRLTTYSLIKKCISDTSKIDRFFDELSTVPYLRKSVQFWIHYHIYKMDVHEYDLAKDFLDNAYREAEKLSGRNDQMYDFKQLDNLKVKYLLTRSGSAPNTKDYAQIMRQCLPLIKKSLLVEEVDYHVYNLFADLSKYINTKGNAPENQGFRSVFLPAIKDIVSLATRKMHLLGSAFATEVAEGHIGDLQKCIV